MIRFAFLCFIVVPLQSLSQRADSAVSTIYVRLIEELSKEFPTPGENIFVINDLYYPAKKEGPAGYDPDRDTLVYSGAFRELTYQKVNSVTTGSGLLFGVPSKYNAVFAEFIYEFTGPHKGKKMQFFYIDQPVNDQDYYDLSFNHRKEFEIHIPVQVFESTGSGYESHVRIYRISSDKKGQLTIQKLT